MSMDTLDRQDNAAMPESLSGQLMLRESPYGFALHRLICDEQNMPADYILLYVNPAYEQITGVHQNDVQGQRGSTVLSAMDRERFNWLRFYAETALNGTRQQTDQYIEWLRGYFRVVAFAPRHGYFATFISDITEDMQRQKQIEYLSYHDQLTGLYNRHYFEHSLQRLNTSRNLPLSLIMADVNGLKISNDTFGHAFGDMLLREAAALVSRHCRADDIIARTGGDEFVFILPRTTADDAAKVIKRIIEAAAKVQVGSIQLSLSLGQATRVAMDEGIQETLKNAEDQMYRQKLTDSPQLRRMIIQSIINRLNANPAEATHSSRVSAMCEAMGRELSMSATEIEDLRKLGLLHDLGKIALPEELINKPASLSDNEWNEIRRHSEISYRILSSLQEYADISESALAHHERWDGKGYPRGLRGDEIPLPGRIIALADAFEAMTSVRPWRPAMSIESATSEIRGMAGKQFDPSLIELFLNRVAPFY
jgi:diguanylate cyclase (GGDEF)-like protein